MLVAVRNPPIDGEDEYRAALTAFRELWEKLVAAERAADPQVHFDRASEVGELLAKYVSENAGERGAAAIRIRDTESLTLTALSERISMSKQRAGKLVERGQKPQGSDNG